jgi:ribonuclease P protein component, eubacterial
LRTFRKEERISSEKEIDFLFENGSSFISYPFRIVFCSKEREEGSRFSILVSVSKRKFKRAVERNRLKRLLRESYRLNKTILENIGDEECPGLDIGFLFVGNSMPDYKQVETAVIKALSAFRQMYLQP